MTPTQYAKKAERRAIELRIEKKPYCYSCGQKAVTAHHHVPKSLSNFLRCDERNMVPICFICHFNHHKRGDPDIQKRYEKQMEAEFGKNWHEDLQRDRHNFISNTVGYWKSVIEQLK